jgi:hypothetical protein
VETETSVSYLFPFSLISFSSFSSLKNSFLTCNLRNDVSSVGIETWRTEGEHIEQDSIIRWGNWYSLHGSAQTGSGAHLAYCQMIPAALFLGVKRPGVKLFTSVYCRIECVKLYLQPPHMYSWRGTYRDNFTFTFTLILSWLIWHEDGGKKILRKVVKYL